MFLGALQDWAEVRKDGMEGGPEVQRCPDKPGMLSAAFRTWQTLLQTSPEMLALCRLWCSWEMWIICYFFLFLFASVVCPTDCFLWAVLHGRGGLPGCGDFSHILLFLGSHTLFFLGSMLESGEKSGRRVVLTKPWTLEQMADLCNTKNSLILEICRLFQVCHAPYNHLSIDTRWFISLLQSFVV